MGLGSFASDWLLGAGALLLAAAAALLAHHLLVTFVQRAIGPDRLFLGQVVASTSGPVRLGLVIVGLAVALAWLPPQPNLTAALARLLLVAFIVLVGWSVTIIVGLAADRYVARFK